jgi:hypothetical protein
VSDTKEKLMKWIKHECEQWFGWREDYALEVLIGILAGAIDGDDVPYGYASLNEIIKDWAEYGVEVTA